MLVFVKPNLRSSQLLFVTSAPLCLPLSLACVRQLPPLLLSPVFGSYMIKGRNNPTTTTATITIPNQRWLPHSAVDVSYIDYHTTKIQQQRTQRHVTQKILAVCSLLLYTWFVCVRIIKQNVLSAAKMSTKTTTMNSGCYSWLLPLIFFIRAPELFTSSINWCFRVCSSNFPPCDVCSSKASPPPPPCIQQAVQQYDRKNKTKKTLVFHGHVYINININRNRNINITSTWRNATKTTTEIHIHPTTDLPLNSRVNLTQTLNGWQLYLQEIKHHPAHAPRTTLWHRYYYYFVLCLEKK